MHSGETMVTYTHADSPRCETLKELSKYISDSILYSNNEDLSIYVENIMLDKKANSDIYFQALTELKKLVRIEREWRRSVVKINIEGG